MGCHFLFQGIFPTQGSNPGLWHCQQIVHHWATRGEANPRKRNLKRSGKVPREFKKNTSGIQARLARQTIWLLSYALSRKTIAKYFFKCPGYWEGQDIQGLTYRWKTNPEFWVVFIEILATAYHRRSDTAQWQYIREHTKWVNTGTHGETFDEANNRKQEPKKLINCNAILERLEQQADEEMKWVSEIWVQPGWVLLEKISHEVSVMLLAKAAV